MVLPPYVLADTTQSLPPNMFVCVCLLCVLAADILRLHVRHADAQPEQECRQGAHTQRLIWLV
jgi:hypothetical protein